MGPLWFGEPNDKIFPREKFVQIAATLDTAQNAKSADAYEHDGETAPAISQPALSAPSQEPPPSGNPATDDPLQPWKIYIRFSQQLERTDPREYEKVPMILKLYGKREIEHLATWDVAALQAMDALPHTLPPKVPEEDVLGYRAYIGLLHKLKTNPQEYEKVPPLLRSFSEKEIQKLSGAHIQALKMMGILPDLSESEKSGPMKTLDEALDELVNSDPELKKLADGKKPEDLAAHPKILAFLAAHPEYQRLLDQEIQNQMQRYMNLKIGDVKLDNPFGNAWAWPWGVALAVSAVASFLPLFSRFF